MINSSQHHPQQVVQLNTVNPQNVNNVQHQLNDKLPGETDNFLTIRLLMQGKVGFDDLHEIFFYFKYFLFLSEYIYEKKAFLAYGYRV